MLRRKVKVVYRPRAKSQKARSARPKKSEAAMERFKTEICLHFQKWLKQTGKQQLELAKKLKIHRSIMSKIVRLQHQDYTADWLMKLLRVIRPDLVPVLKKIPNSKKK